jgi:hypothetical protein
MNNLLLPFYLKNTHREKRDVVWKAVGYRRRRMGGYERRSIYQARCVCAHTIHSAMGSVVRSGPELMKADRLCVWCAAAGAHHPLSIFIDVHPKE